MAFKDFLSAEDRALLAREFSQADPEQVPNLVERLPEASGPPKIIARYHVDHARPRLRCSKCGQRLHWKGYVLELPEELHALLAERQCGRDAFGLKWDQVEREFLQQESRQSDLFRLQKIHTAFPAFVHELGCLLTHEQVRAYDRYFHDLLHTFGPLSRGLARAPKQQGLFNAEIYVRNTAAEYARAKREAPDLVEEAEDISVSPAERQKNNRRLEKWLNQQEPIWKIEVVRLEGCLGDGILREDRPSVLLQKAIALANEASGWLGSRSSSEWTATALTQGFKSLGQLADLVDDVFLLLGKFERFTSSRNISVLANWATRDNTIEGEYRAEGRAIIDEHGNRLEAGCKLEPINAPAFVAFLEAFGRPQTYSKAA